LSQSITKTASRSASPSERRQKHVQIILADGFEEIEAIAIIDILRRADIQVDIMGLGKQDIVSARGLRINTDRILIQIPETRPDMLIVPGGEPGTSHLEESTLVRDMILKQHQAKKWIAAICAAPRILDALGILEGRQATSFPGIKDRMSQCLYSEDSVVISDHIVTSRGAGTALQFAYTLVSLLASEELAQRLQAEMVYPT